MSSNILIDSVSGLKLSLNPIASKGEEMGGIHSSYLFLLLSTTCSFSFQFQLLGNFREILIAPKLSLFDLSQISLHDVF